MSDKEKKAKKNKSDKDKKSGKKDRLDTMKHQIQNEGDDEGAKKVLVLFGSPKKNGHTRTLVDTFIKARNLEAEFIFVNGLNIKGCQGCLYCQSHDGECKPKYDMTEL